MSNRIYFKEFAEPKVVTYRVGIKEHTVTSSGEYICDSPLVKKVWFIGMTSPNPDTPIKSRMEMLFNDGGRANFECPDNEFEITMAAGEKYLDEGGIGEK